MVRKGWMKRSVFLLLGLSFLLSGCGAEEASAPVVTYEKPVEDTLPDVFCLDTEEYEFYVSQGKLADLSALYEDSELRSRAQEDGKEEAVEEKRIRGRLYGIPDLEGRGYTTYVRKDWLNRVALPLPTDYKSFVQLMQAFTYGDPDGDGILAGKFAVSAPGVLDETVPFIQSLCGFYQDAYPWFYMDSEGVWRDGFTEESMMAAMIRLREAYDIRLIDPTILSNTEEICRQKFLEGQYGMITLDSETTAAELTEELLAAGQETELIPLPPIGEALPMLERGPVVWCVSASCKDPEQAFRLLEMTMLGGSDAKELWNRTGEYETDAWNRRKLFALRKELIGQVMTREKEPEEAFAEYEAMGGTAMSAAILDALNLNENREQQPD